MRMTSEYAAPAGLADSERGSIIPAVTTAVACTNARRESESFVESAI
jgi:hypothetical protein